MNRLVTLVVVDTPENVATVRGSLEHNADPKESPASVGKIRVPIQSNKWGPGVKDASTPPLRAWTFWWATTLHDTRARMLELVAAGEAQFFIWDDDKGRENRRQFRARWQAAVGWKPRFTLDAVLEAIRNALE